MPILNPDKCYAQQPIYNPKKNTIGQAQSFRNYLEYHHHEHVAIVSSAFHLARVARTFGLDSPQMDEARLDEDLLAHVVEWRSNPLDNLKLYLFGVHKNEARPGMKKDLAGEVNAMQQYSSGDKPTISTYQSKNVFFTNEELYANKSFAKALFWSNYALKNSEIDEDDTRMALS